VNNSHNTIYVGGGARRVTPFQGKALLDNRGNDNPASSLTPFPEHYVITVNLDNNALIQIVDTGGGSGVDDLVVFGTNQADNIALNAAGAGDFRVGFIRASVVSNTQISFQGLERVEIYTLGGADEVLVNDTATITAIDMVAGD